MLAFCKALLITVVIVAVFLAIMAAASVIMPVLIVGAIFFVVYQAMKA